MPVFTRQKISPYTKGIVKLEADEEERHSSTSLELEAEDVGRKILSLKLSNFVDWIAVESSAKTKAQEKSVGNQNPLLTVPFSTCRVLK
jgi:hypothetical protein